MDIIALLESRFGSNYIYEVLEYNEIKSLSMVRVICKKHNNIEEGLVINLLHKKIPCGICEEEDGGNIEGEKVEKLNRKKYQLAELIEKFESVHGNRFLYHDLAYFYVNMKTPQGIFLCNRFITSPSSTLLCFLQITLTIDNDLISLYSNTS